MRKQKLNIYLTIIVNDAVHSFIRVGTCRVGIIGKQHSDYQLSCFSLVFSCLGEQLLPYFQSLQGIFILNQYSIRLNTNTGSELGAVALAPLWKFCQKHTEKDVCLLSSQTLSSEAWIHQRPSPPVSSKRKSALKAKKKSQEKKKVSDDILSNRIQLFLK